MTVEKRTSAACEPPHLLPFAAISDFGPSTFGESVGALRRNRECCVELHNKTASLHQAMRLPITARKLRHPISATPITPPLCSIALTNHPRLRSIQGKKIRKEYKIGEFHNDRSPGWLASCRHMSTQDNFLRLDLLTIAIYLKQRTEELDEESGACHEERPAGRTERPADTRKRPLCSRTTHLTLTIPRPIGIAFGSGGPSSSSSNAAERINSGLLTGGLGTARSGGGRAGRAIPT